LGCRTLSGDQPVELIETTGGNPPIGISDQRQTECLSGSSVAPFSVLQADRPKGGGQRSGSKEAFRKQIREEFVRRSGAASLDEALVTGITSLVPALRQTLGSRNRVARSPKPRKPAL
jgi:hypothetical protein